MKKLILNLPSSSSGKYSSSLSGTYDRRFDRNRFTVTGPGERFTVTGVTGPGE